MYFKAQDGVFLPRPLQPRDFTLDLISWPRRSRVLSLFSLIVCRIGRLVLGAQRLLGSERGLFLGVVRISQLCALELRGEIWGLRFSVQASTGLIRGLLLPWQRRGRDVIVGGGERPSLSARRTPG